MFGAHLLTLYRRGGALNGDFADVTTPAGRAFCFAARDTYTCGAVTVGTHGMGAVVAQVFHPGAAVVGDHQPGGAIQDTFTPGAAASQAHC